MEHPLLGGRYQIIRRLSSGGFSRTFLVADLHLPGHPRCVIKQLKVQDKDTSTLDMARRLFDTEAKVLYQLGNHPQIPTLLAHFEEEQEFYLAQEYIEGSRLSHQIEEGKPWTETRVVLLLQEVLEILAFVHRQQVIHRDVKPSNLIRRHRDGKVVLIDFGAVKQVSSSPLVDAETGATNLTVAIGTHGYMPNEQYAGKPRFSSDVYAAGIMGIRALTGLHPQKMGEDPDTCELAWRTHAPSVSAALADVLDRMVRYDFRDRYPTAQEALEALRQLPTSFGSSITQMYQTWHRGVGGLVPSHQSEPGEARLVPAETSEITAIATAQEVTSIFPVDLIDVVPESLAGSELAEDPIPLVSQSALAAPATPQLPPVRRKALRRSSIWLVGGMTGLVGIFLGLWQSGFTVAFESVDFRGVQPLLSMTIPSFEPDLEQLLPDPQRSIYLVRQGDRQLAQRLSPDALATYDEAITIQPDYAPAYLGRCRALLRLKRPSEAIAACNDALAYRSPYPEAVLYKGRAEEQQGRLQAALALYERATRLQGDIPEAWLGQGRVLQKLGRSAEALRALDQSIALYRDSAEAWTIRGEANWRLERYNLAMVDFDKALQINPDYEPAQQGRQQVRQVLGR